MKMENNLRSRKGAWTREEDDRLRTRIATYGEGQWHRVPLRAGLDRCIKSCRLRWLNYLKPDIKGGEFEDDEVDLIMRLHELLGNRWTLIAGRMPGRTANDVKNYWNTHLKKLISSKEITTPKITRDNIIRPRASTLSKKYFFGSDNQNGIQIGETSTNPCRNSVTFTLPQSADNNENSLCWETLIGDDNGNGEDQQMEEVKEYSNNINIINNETSCYEQYNNMWSDFCLDDLNLWDLLDAP